MSVLYSLLTAILFFTPIFLLASKLKLNGSWMDWLLVIACSLTFLLFPKLRNVEKWKIVVSIAINIAVLVGLDFWLLAVVFHEGL
jgi:hypothetical protein